MRTHTINQKLFATVMLTFLFLVLTGAAFLSKGYTESEERGIQIARTTWPVVVLGYLTGLAFIWS